MAQAVKALVWDLDGTITDSFGMFVELMHELAPVFDLPLPSREIMLENYHGGLAESIQASLGGALSEPQLEDFVTKFLDKQQGHYEVVETCLLEDALDLAKRATKLGLKQVIVTNRDHAGRGKASPRHIVSSSSLKEHIHEVICGDEAQGFRKPDPKVLGDLLERWGITPQEVLVIGDQHVDAQLALNLGSKAVLVVRDGSEFAHAHKLDKNWQEHVTVVESLKDVTI